MQNTVVDNFLKSFFRLHDAIIKENEYEKQVVIGHVFWLDDVEDTQAFRWHIEVNENEVIKMRLLCDFLFDKNLVDGDRIIISEPELIENLKSAHWNIKNIKSAINALMSTEVKMLDDGEETDSFFIHF